MIRTPNVVKEIVIMFILLGGSAFGQTQKSVSGSGGGQVWEIPFASKDNTISLSVQNSSSIEAKNVTVMFDHLPSWLEFRSNKIVLRSIAAKRAGEADFMFSVHKKAPVGKDTTLTATISTSEGQKWTKDITVAVGAPRNYKLYNNFPNPFNPTTKIAFELPRASHARLVIYDVVGREVAQIADGDYPAGYNELTWNGLNRNGEEVASGVYFYRISADKWNKVMKMLMIK